MKKNIIYYFFFLLSIFSILSSGVIDSQDGFQYLAVARNIYYTGKPTAPVYEYDQRKNVHMTTIVGKDGDTYSLTGLGYSLAYLPAVAITDIVYKIYHVSPPIHFPLENDWLIFLTASLTNGFFASLLGVIILLYLIELGLSKKQAIFISLIGLFATNLFVYAKHSFPHMMFNTFLFSSFYLIKIHFRTKRILFLILAGLSFGITTITYNQTFALSIIPIAIYFLFLSKFKLNISSTKDILSKFLLFLLGWFPFILIYFWFENLRAFPTANFASSSVASAKAVVRLLHPPVSVFIEGLYGQLFSPGRSIFIYSPLLLVPLIFWNKIKKQIRAELIVFLTLSIIYILFFSTLYTIGRPDQGLAAIWHGESSWGPRYLTPLIPFGLLITGSIFINLSSFQKKFIFFPFIAIGFYVQMLGIIMPYQIKFHDLQPKFFLNGTEYTNFSYSNFLPRYSPIFMMSKKLIRLTQNLPKTLDHGKYNVRFYDGVDFSFNVGPERWRVTDEKGYIGFDNSNDSPLEKISLALINHPIEEASYSAIIQFSLNDQKLLEKEAVFLPTERRLIDLNIPENLLKPKNNLLAIDVRFKSLQDNAYLSEINQYKDNPSTYENKNVQPKKYVSQILGMISFFINDKEVNKETLDFPYISALGPKMMGIKYTNWGGENKDPWKTWHIHTQIYERVPDFWWMKFLYYWDVPKMPILILLAGIVLVSIYSGLKTFILIIDDKF